MCLYDELVPVRLFASIRYFGTYMGICGVVIIHTPARFALQVKKNAMITPPLVETFTGEYSQRHSSRQL